MSSDKTDFDVIVAGNGISVAPLIWHISQTSPGVRMLIIDRAKFVPPSEIIYPTMDQQARKAGLLTENGTQGTIDVDYGAGPRELKKWWVPDVSGGGSILWYGQMSRFEARDFTVGSSVADRTGFEEVRDWPIGLEELQPFYRAIERELTPYGSRYGCTQEELGTLDCEVVTERPMISSFEKAAIDAMRRAEIKAFVGQTCLGGRIWDSKPLDPMHPDEQILSRASLLFRPNWFSRIAELIASSPNIEVADCTRVESVRVQGQNVCGVNVVSGQEDGLSHGAFRAPIVILGLGALESVRTLMQSNIPDPSHLLGRRLTFTQEKIAYLRTNIPRSQDPIDASIGRFGSVTVKDFCHPRSNTPVRGGKVSVYDAHEAEVPRKLQRNLGLPPEEYAAVSHSTCRTVLLKLSFKGESVPSARKHMKLGPKRDAHGIAVPLVTYGQHPEDVLIGEYGIKAFREIARAFPGSRLVVPPQRQGTAVVSAHHHGGAVFGSDPSDSVLTPDCEHHTVSNLYVVDGSLMPTSGSTNSSHTLMANSLRVAHIVANRVGAAGRSMSHGL
ncbi:MAG TPA: GMC oxidoreductase [Acidimicrobiia bacterium]|nr:GMC oxidoreductase [Acidimicrobiia bacterium]